MKKMMFNDRYGLTQAVLEGRKTMTRRIVKGIVPAVKELRINGNGLCEMRTTRWATCHVQPKYKLGEDVAVAQSYLEAYEELLADEDWDNHRDKWKAFRHFLFNGEDHTVLKGWKNKMFVKSEVMPNRICITDIKVERLQACSDDDILKEGIFQISAPIYNNGIGYTFKGWTDRGVECSSDTPKGAFKALIDKISGRGTFESNPYVFAYSFKLLD